MSGCLAEAAGGAGSGVDAVVLFLPHNVSYFAKFGFMVTERPVALAVTPSRAGYCWCRAWRRNTRKPWPSSDDVVDYPEFPDVRHPMEFLRDVLRELGLARAALGCDAPGAPQVFGYRGPGLAELLPDARVRKRPGRDRGICR